MRYRNVPRFVWTLVEVLADALRVEFALRRHPFDQVLSDMSRTPRSRPNARDITVATLGRAIRVAYRILPVEATCLKQSLVFCRVRRRHGLPAELRIGVQKNDGLFAAHAWVEDEAGHVLTDPRDGFSPLPLPSIRDQRASD